VVVQEESAALKAAQGEARVGFGELLGRLYPLLLSEVAPHRRQTAEDMLGTEYDLDAFVLELA